MTAAFVNYAVGQSPDGSGFDTNHIDTSGVSLIVVGVSAFAGTATVTDSKSNTPSALTLKTNNGFSQLIYFENPTVGPDHYWSLSGASFGRLIVATFSGMATASVFDTESSGGTGVTGAPCSAGSITPAGDGEVFVTMLESRFATDGVYSIDSSYNIVSQGPVAGGQALGGALAYFIQGTAGALNPTWTISSTVPDDTAAVHAAFKAATGGGGVVGSYFYRLVAGMDGTT